MDGRRPWGMMFAPSGADPAWPVGGAVCAEGHGWPGANHHLRLPCPAMDGRRPRGTMFAPSGADPAWPVGAANMSEPQDAASESIRQGRYQRWEDIADAVAQDDVGQVVVGRRLLVDDHEIG